jgi:hypothetical protein
VGEVFDVEASDVEPLRRALWIAQRGRDAELPQVASPVLGGSFVAARESVDGTDALVLRARLRHAALVPLDAPGGKGRTVGYAAAVDRDRTLGVATGLTLRYVSSHHTRLRVEDPTTRADYTVDVSQRATLSTSLVPR